MIEIQNLMDDLIAISREAGDAILEVYERPIDVMTKEDESPLTEADLASHAVIRDALKALTPDIPLLSEESAAIPFDTRRNWNEYWLVDPLDGTKEFINRNGEFTVNIALIREHRPVAGVVHVPVREQTFYGISGVGAWRKDGGFDPTPISTRRPPAEVPVIVGSRSHANPKLDQCLARVGEYEIASMGSSLKFCLVAEGSADLYPRLGPTSEWDTAAAQAVVEGAGGMVVGLEGNALPYNRKDEYLNPWFLVLGDPDAGWLERLDTDV